ncbi:MAG: VTT domain-containing protein [Desulfobacter sp.]|nr:MAG: VTT domain-containing protein [Desulfobacter sp.]
MPQPNKQRLKKIAVCVLLLAVVGACFGLGLPDYLSLDRLRQSQEMFQEFYARHPLLSVAIFAGIYIPVLALNIPGAVVLGLAAGALFGTITGTVVVSFASSIGATLGCLTSRYLLREWVQEKFGGRLERVNQGIEEEGAFYLFSMRLIPAIPFFAINLVMGLTPMRLTTFYWVSQLGMLPGTAIFVNAGSQIAQIDSLSGIISGQLAVSLALIGLFPLAAKRLVAALRKGRKNEDTAAPIRPGRSPEGIAADAAGAAIKEACTGCGACQPRCTFLSRYGTPREIADLEPCQRAALAFECSLCGLCRTVCPQGLDPEAWFLSLRRAAVSDGRADLSRYSTITGYEKRGTSPLFSYYALPENCDTVFFPGCTLPGTRPQVTWDLFQHLRSARPSLGVVLDCCSKPSHDLGRQGYFKAMFGELLDFLKDNGVKRVWVACPNCHKVFSTYAAGIKVESVYEIIHRRGPLPDLGKQCVGDDRPIIHDPCPMRDTPVVQDAVRSLLSKMDVPVGKTTDEKRKTLCCGEGGSVGFINPELSGAWATARKKTARGRTVVTYCAGCAGALNRSGIPALHILDLLFSARKPPGSPPAVAKAPFTYLHRLALKRRLKRTVPAAVSRVRRYSPAREDKRRGRRVTRPAP